MSRIWQVPPRNPNFVGRLEQLSRLRHALASTSQVTVQAVRGMGGVGKTQLAIEYAHQRSTDYDLVWFIASENVTVLPDEFAALGAALGLEPTRDPDGIRLAVQAALQDVQRWLIIFDNADEVRDVASWIPHQPLGPGRYGHVLVTTRRGGFGAIGSVVDLDVITAEDAVALLRTRVPSIETSVANGIAEQLGFLPLALEQAAAYLDRSQQPPSEHALFLRDRLPDMLDVGRDEHRAETTVATLWSLSLAQLSEHQPASVQLIEIAPNWLPSRSRSTFSAAIPSFFPSRCRALPAIRWTSTTPQLVSPTSPSRGARRTGW